MRDLHELEALAIDSWPGSDPPLSEHSCGEGGDAIRLLMRARGLDFATAVRELAA